jgi:ABC-type tungstate transport system substrate-binding protein
MMRAVATSYIIRPDISYRQTPLNSVFEAAAQGFGLIAAADPQLTGIVALSLRVSLSAVLIACAIGLPLGAAIAVNQFPGQRVLIIISIACSDCHRS